MIKVTIVDFYTNKNTAALSSIGLKDKDSFIKSEEEVRQLMGDIFFNGLNVMTRRTDDGIILFVSHRGFSQYG